MDGSGDADVPHSIEREQNKDPVGGPRTSAEGSFYRGKPSFDRLDRVGETISSFLRGPFRKKMLPYGF